MTHPALALSRGEALSLTDDAPGSIGGALAARVAACPHGLIRTYDTGGVRRSITYADAWTRSARIAAALAPMLEPNQPVVLALRDAVDFVPAYLACLRGGHVVAALGSAVEAATHPMGELALQNLLRKLGHPVLLVDDRLLSMPVGGMLSRDHRVLPLSAARGSSANGPSANENAAWDGAVERPDPTCLVATSGSTGSIKLAILEPQALRHRYFPRGTEAPRRGIHNLVLFPTDSITGLQMAFLTSETCTQIAPDALAGRPGTILEAIGELGITQVSMTNSMALRVLEAEPELGPSLDLGSLKGLGLGGEAVGRDVAARLDAMLTRRGAANIVRAGYGATEVGTIVTGANPLDGPPGDDQNVPLGPCAPGVSMRIVGEDGAVLEEGTVGEVEVSTPLKAFSGYWGEPELSRTAFTPDGWWRTGDLGQLDAGIFTFRGRSKQTLVVHGRKLSLVEIDAHLQADPEIGVPTYSCALRSPGDATDRLGIAFVARKGEATDAIAETIRSLALRRFGLRADPVVAVPRARLPLTPTGKIRRGELPGLLIAQRQLAVRRASASSQLEARPRRGEIETALEVIWREVLDLAPGFDRARTFFECGGDSLRSAALYACVEAAFDRQLDMPAFFAEPTFAGLIRLVERGQAPAQDDAGAPDGPMAWPLPTAFRQKQLAFLEIWPGERMTRDRLVTGLNTDGPLPPLFCVLQTAEEFSSLAGALGAPQPVYAFRSAFRVADYTEEIVQSIALRYVHDLEQVRPSGPIFLLGQCQGANIAIAMAQHLMRRGRHLPLLVLVEWSTAPAHYPGRTLILQARDSLLNPKRLHREPASAWQRMFPDHSAVDIPGGYAKLYAGESLPILARELRDRFEAAVSRPPRLLPGGACRVRLSVASVPKRLMAGRSARLDVTVVNVGGIVISATSGLRLGNYWTRDDDTTSHRLDMRVALPDIAPGAAHRIRVRVRAPTEPGRYRLCLDLVEEGHRWLGPIGRGSFCAEIEVEKAPPTAFGRWLRALDGLYALRRSRAQASLPSAKVKLGQPHRSD